MLNIIFKAIDEINADRSEYEKIKKEKDTPLWGPDASIDSLGIVMLSLLIEESILDKYNVQISLASMDDKEQGEVFATVNTLYSYINEQLDR